ncbi:cyclin-dependent kinase inhibitor 3-like [Procambarus clarkii]|uniref:cyclin-dependent kinase inhibitor 3-like n=1 Tax=Procambarus clarkii TaxID=6728 RepID=UPI0037447D22
MFGSSDSDDESSQALVQTLKVDWLDMSFIGCPQSVALSGLPGCRFRNVYQNLHMDLKSAVACWTTWTARRESWKCFHHYVRYSSAADLEDLQYCGL